MNTQRKRVNLVLCQSTGSEIAAAEGGGGSNKTRARNRRLKQTFSQENPLQAIRGRGAVMGELNGFHFLCHP